MSTATLQRLSAMFHPRTLPLLQMLSPCLLRLSPTPTFPSWFALVLEPRKPFRPRHGRDAPPAAGVHLVAPTPWTQERRPPGPRSYRLSPHAQHKARHTAGDHKCDLSAPMRLDWTWCKPHPGKVPFRGGPTRPGNARVSCTAGNGMGAGLTAAADGTGARSAAARPLAGGSHQERQQHPPPRRPRQGRDPAATVLGPAIRHPGAPGQGPRRRGGDSPHAGGSPRRRPRAARRWRPGPWQRPGSGARAPNLRTDPVPPARTRPLGARLPAPCHVGASLLPPLTLTLLATGGQLRLQGRARLRLPAARGVPGTLTPESRPARHHQTPSWSGERPEMSCNDSSLMVCGPGAARPLPLGLSAPGPVTPRALLLSCHLSAGSCCPLYPPFSVPGCYRLS